MRLFKALVALTLFGLLQSADAQSIFNKYEPASGIQKNTGTTYRNTTAVAADIYGLWSGTCSASTFLNGAGACASVSATPGGSTGQIQFNSSGSFGGSANFLWDNTNNVLTLNGAGGGVIDSTTSNPLSFIGGNGLTDLTSSSLTLLSGGGSTGAGGGATLNGGAGAVTGAGGSVQINGGNAAGTNQNGGGISIAGGTLTGSGSGGLVQFLTAGTIRETVNYDGGITLGSPTGGSKGAGTLNMTGCFVNNVACSTGSGTPGGANTNVQYNNSGAFAGDSGFTYNNSTHNISLTGGIFAGPSQFSGGGATVATFNSFANSTNGGIIVETTGTSSGEIINLENAGVSQSQWCVSGSAGGCTLSDAAGDTSLLTLGAPFHISTANTNASGFNIASANGGVTVGSPTGGAKGAGTINMTGCFINNVACSTGSAATLIASLSGGVSASGIAVGQTALAAKTTATNRNTVTTTSNDPDLVITSVPAGTYTLHGYVEVSCVNTTMGMQFNVNTSATTSTSNNYNGIFGYQGGTVAAAANTPALATTQTSILQSLTAANCGVNTNSIGLDGTFTTTGSGTIGFSWAQSVSNGSNLQVGQSSFLQITRIN